jgi:hypothetical protein
MAGADAAGRCRPSSVAPSECRHLLGESVECRQQLPCQHAALVPRNNRSRARVRFWPTTVVLVTAAWTTGRPSVALEEDARWPARLGSAVPKQARSWLDCKVLPLISYGDFDWYDVGTVHLPETVGLVVCDGPRGRTRGGRYGLGPVMKDRLAPGCVVLIDDTHRTEEREILNRWCTELPAHVIEAGEKFSAIKIGNPPGL